MIYLDWKILLYFDKGKSLLILNLISFAYFFLYYYRYQKYVFAFKISFPFSLIN